MNNKMKYEFFIFKNLRTSILTKTHNNFMQSGHDFYCYLLISARVCICLCVYIYMK